MTSSSKKQLNSYGTFCVYLLSSTIIKTPNLGISFKMTSRLSDTWRVNANSYRRGCHLISPYYYLI